MARKSFSVILALVCLGGLSCGGTGSGGRRGGAPLSYNPPPAVFNTPPDFYIGRISGMAAADFDGANGPDLAVTLQESDLIHVFFNDGKGGYGEPITLPGSHHPRWIYSADFNRDGAADLLVQEDSEFASSQNYPQSWSIRLGDGAGGFGAPVKTDFGKYLSSSMAIGTFDGDSIPDVIAGTVPTGGVDYFEVAFFSGAGDGSFLWGDTIASMGSDEIRDMASAMIDGDSILDLVLATDNNLYLLIGNGDGTFLAPVTLPGHE